MKKKPELLVPAGNYSKFETAVLYGADAVYLAGQTFGMRAAADNFSIEEIHRAAEYAHNRGVKVYVTVNTMPRVHEYSALSEYLTALNETGADALIIADLGVMALAKKLAPKLQIHISTQAGAVSHADCIEWYRLGASRVVLARELTLSEIRIIRREIPEELELETFVHGSMCVSWSGRCLLSAALTGRDSNRGMCAQPCRWNYKLYKGKTETEPTHKYYEIEEETRPGQRFPIVEDELGTFVMSSKDMCMINHVGELCEAGIASLKIEGRMKSAYYAAVTANAYRMAIDGWFAHNGPGYKSDPMLLTELESVSHREYCTGYFFDDCRDDAQLISNVSLGYIREKAYLAIAKDYDPNTGIATFMQRNKLCAGDEVAIISPGKLSRSFTAEKLYDQNGNTIESAPHPYMIFQTEVPFEIKPGDIMRGA